MRIANLEPFGADLAPQGLVVVGESGFAIESSFEERIEVVDIGGADFEKA